MDARLGNKCYRTLTNKQPSMYRFGVSVCVWYCFFRSCFLLLHLYRSECCLNLRRMYVIQIYGKKKMFEWKAFIRRHAGKILEVISVENFVIEFCFPFELIFFSLFLGLRREFFYVSVKVFTWWSYEMKNASSVLLWERKKRNHQSY